MEVLSLFDGMSCGRLALQKMDVQVTTYYAAEIDKHAVKLVAEKWPATVQLASVTGVHAAALPKIDIVIGGSPCQGFSFAGKQLNFDDPRSALFFEYVRILKECRERNPDIMFLLENVRMRKEHEDVISNQLGIQPININSGLLSAQNRERLYWTNIGMVKHGLFGDNHCSIPQPKDLGLCLADILEPEVDERYYLSTSAIDGMRKRKEDNRTKGNGFGAAFRTKEEKSPTISARYYKDGADCLVVCVNPIGKAPTLLAGGCSRDVKVTGFNQVEALNKRHKMQYRKGNEKGNAFLATSYKGAQANGMTLVADNVGRVRRLTPTEVARLQTVPDGYFLSEDGGKIVSDTQAYKMCGNGWTVDVISYILSHSKKIQNHVQKSNLQALDSGAARLPVRE